MLKLRRKRIIYTCLCGAMQKAAGFDILFKGSNLSSPLFFHLVCQLVHLSVSQLISLYVSPSFMCLSVNLSVFFTFFSSFYAFTMEIRENYTKDDYWPI